MSQSKSVAPVSVRTPPNSREQYAESDLHLQLREEIDKLAVLLREVTIQAERVQEAADAIGERLSLEIPILSTRPNRHRSPKKSDGTTSV